MTKLDYGSCQWAIQSLQKVRHNDSFPRPFEYEVIAHFSDDVVDYFSQKDIGSHGWVRGRSALVPKEMISFRHGIQLDPMDSLFLSTIIHQSGPKIEKARFSKEENVVFSHRFDPNENDFYTDKVGWNKFWEKSKEKAEIGKGWVVIADIASYYSQIYHPRVRDQLVKVKLPKDVVKSIMKLLGTLTDGIPRGIPVGPRSVHLLAECAFIPIDKSLRRKKYDYCRYIDDIHIFCKTREGAITTLFDLANILYKHQRFTLQRHNTQVIPADEFIEIANRKLKGLPSNELEKDIKGVIDSHSANPYDSVDVNKLKKEDLALFDQKGIEQLINEHLEADEPDYWQISWLFRKLAQVGLPSAVTLALSRIEDLMPVIADVCHYFSSVQEGPDVDWEEVGGGLLDVIDRPIIQHSEYLTLMLLDMYSRIPSMDHSDPILNMYPKASPMIRRKIVRAATAQREDDWLQEHKGDLSVSGPWLKRALIAGGSVFSKDERESWLGSVEQGGTFLDKLVSRWARGESIPEGRSLIYGLVKDLREKMAGVFSINDTIDLCFELNIDYENLPHSTKDEIQRELIRFCKDKGRIQELINICYKKRPNEIWPDISIIQQLENDDRPF